MGAARSCHTATLLGNGKVLVVGGFDGCCATASVERYDPASNSWTDAGTLDCARSAHSATLLQDGATVAVFGGDPFQANLELWR